MTAVLFFVLLGLLLLNVPIAVCLTLACGAAMVVGGLGGNLVVLPQKMFTAMDSFPFMAVPFFMLAGGIMESGGISKRIISFAKALIGWVPGALSVITVLASGFFGAISGSNAATVSAIGGMMIPSMREDGYENDYACAVAASAGTLGVVVPPSTPMITFGVVSGVSIGTLFMAGFVPAILMIVTLSTVMIIRAHNLHVSTIPFSLKNLWSAFLHSILALLMPVIILGGIYGGIFTPTESAAVAIVYALIVSMGIYREIKPRDLPRIIIAAGRSTATVMFVIAASGAFSWLLVYNRIPETIANAVLNVVSNKYVILLILNLLMLVLGVFLETNAIILMITPMLLPIADRIGVSYLEIGLIMVVNTSVGMLTPPMALNILIAAGIGHDTIERISKKVIPFLLVLILDIFIITYVPGFATFLPKLLGMI